MASTPQKSKGKRPPLRDRLTALEPTPAGFQCALCLGVYDRAGTCCGQRTYPFYRTSP